MLKKETIGFACFGIIVFLLAAFIFGPILLIWSCNTLFSAGIEYTSWNWLAGLTLMLCLRGGAVGSSK